MNILNNYALQGYIAHDLELKSTKNGKTYVSFLIKVNDHYYDKNKEQFIKRYMTVPFIAFNQVAINLYKQTIKGQKVLINFEIFTQDRNIDDEHSFLQVNLKALRFETLESKNQATDRLKNTLQEDSKEENQEDDKEIVSKEEIIEKETDAEEKIENEVHNEKDINNELNQNNYKNDYSIENTDDFF